MCIHCETTAETCRGAERTARRHAPSDLCRPLVVVAPPCCRLIIIVVILIPALVIVDAGRSAFAADLAARVCRRETRSRTTRRI